MKNSTPGMRKKKADALRKRIIRWFKRLHNKSKVGKRVGCSRQYASFTVNEYIKELRETKNHQELESLVK